MCASFERGFATVVGSLLVDWPRGIRGEGGDEIESGEEEKKEIMYGNRGKINGVYNNKRFVPRKDARIITSNKYQYRGALLLHSSCVCMYSVHVCVFVATLSAGPRTSCRTGRCARQRTTAAAVH